MVASPSSVASELGFTVTDEQLLRLIHMQQEKQRRAEAHQAARESQAAEMYAAQAAERGVCHVHRSQRIAPLR
jgi:hypothetical protein